MVTARAVAETVTDPELPQLTLADLGVLREVKEEDGRVTVSITPTYTGCPAMDTMRDDLIQRLTGAGYAEVDVRVVLRPAWSTDWISASGREKLAAAGIAPPGPSGGPVALAIRLRCPRCGSPDTEELSRFGSTACKALWRCRACAEPFDHVKAH